jgi:hypothetical protein
MTGLLLFIGLAMVAAAGYLVGVNQGMSWMRETLLMDGYLVLERRNRALGCGRWQVFDRNAEDDTRNLPPVPRDAT